MANPEFDHKYLRDPYRHGNRQVLWQIERKNTDPCLYRFLNCGNDLLLLCKVAKRLGCLCMRSFLGWLGLFNDRSNSKLRFQANTEDDKRNDKCSNWLYGMHRFYGVLTDSGLGTKVARFYDLRGYCYHRRFNVSFLTHNDQDRQVRTARLRYGRR